MRAILSLSYLQTIYKDNVEIMQSRYEQVENSLSSFSVECFRNKSALNYYAVHEGIPPYDFE